MVTIKSETKSYGIIFPSDVNEISANILKQITSGVNLPKHYCIVALCFKTRVFDFAMMISSKKETNIAVIPLLAKISDNDSEEINAKVGQKLIIDRTNLERGVHLRLPIMVSSDNARKYISDDPKLVKSILNKDDTYKKITNDGLKDIIIMEFKIIPVNDISAAIDIDNKVIDPFIYKANIGQA